MSEIQQIRDAISKLVSSFTVPMQSENIDELSSALVEAQYSLEGARKDSNNPFFKSKYADLETCVGALREPLHENGLAYSQTSRMTDQGPVLVTTLMHRSGQWIKGELPLSAKEACNPQAQGSAITYARRYALSAITGLVQIDDDGESAQGRGQQQKKPQAGTASTPFQKTEKGSASTNTATQKTTSAPTAKDQSTPGSSATPASPTRSPSKTGPVEGEEPAPTDAEVVGEAKQAPPDADVFPQFLQAGINNGWTEKQVEDFLEGYLKSNKINTDLPSMTAIANQMTWPMVEAAVNHLLSTKPETK